MWTGDNLPIMRGMNSASIDLIYLDPPFNSKANYAAPIGSEAAGAEFKDTWTLSDVDAAWLDLIETKHPALNRVIHAALNTSDKSYLIYMAVRLLEMRRLLKDTGSIYLHCDPTMSHYLKLVMDAIFGRKSFRNELIWHYGKMSNAVRNFPRNHDVILRYTKTDDWQFIPVKGDDSEYRTRYRRYLTGNQVSYESVSHLKDKLVQRRIRSLEKNLGRPLERDDILFDFDSEFKAQSDVMYVPIIKGNAAEKVGYPTQKPLKLLQRIIKASSNEGDMVLDPFCGCATACIAAEMEHRQWAGIDISPKAAELIKMRVKREMGLFYDGIHRTDIPERTDIEPLRKYNHADNKKLLYGEQGGYCNGCRLHFERQNLTVDHIIARSMGGTDHLSNLQLLCSHCNSVKGDRGQDYLLAKLAA